MKLKKGLKYHVENSSLLIHVLNIAYSGGNNYIKARLRLTNKFNGIFYEEKYFKLNLENIAHWKLWQLI